MKGDLKFCILGAGGIGCYYGARLLERGHKVTFVARGAHLQALQENGLRLRHPEFSWNGPVEALDLDQMVASCSPDAFDVILVCVKSTATESVAGVLQGWFRGTGQQTLVISLQNGIDNESIQARYLGEDIVGGGLAVRIGGHIIGPGVVEATGIAQIILGSWPNEAGKVEARYGGLLEMIAEAMNEAAIPTRKVGNIRHELWRKLVINNGVNPLSALTRLDTYTMSHHPHFGPIVHSMMQEAASVAIADGEQLNEQDVEEMYELIRTFDPIKTSMLVDLEKGRELELDGISGAIMKRAKRIGVAVPYTETIYALLRHQLDGTEGARTDG